jgi:transposase-like protein
VATSVTQQEHEAEHPSRWAAISSIAAEFGISHETLRDWVRRAEVVCGPA